MAVCIRCEFDGAAVTSRPIVAGGRLASMCAICFGEGERVDHARENLPVGTLLIRDRADAVAARWCKARNEDDARHVDHETRIAALESP